MKFLNTELCKLDRIEDYIAQFAEADISTDLTLTQITDAAEEHEYIFEALEHWHNNQDSTSAVNDLLGKVYEVVL